MRGLLRAGTKRASPPRASDYTKTFRKDWERLARSGCYDLKRLKEAMLLLPVNRRSYERDLSCLQLKLKKGLIGLLRRQRTFNE